MVKAGRGRRDRERREIVRSCTQRHNFFINRVVGPWYDLPDEVVDVTTVNGFKSKLEEHWNSTASKGAVNRRPL